MKTVNLLSIRRLILASSLSILPLAISSAAYAGNTHSVNVQVNGLLELETLSPSTNHTFDTASTGTVSVSLGDVRVRSNQKNGFIVQITSANNGFLQDGADTSSQIPYTVTSAPGQGTGGQGTPVSSVTPITTAQPFYTSDTFKNQNCAPNNGSNGCDIGVTIEYDANNAASLPGATYTDTITYTVLAQ